MNCDPVKSSLILSAKVEDFEAETKVQSNGCAEGQEVKLEEGETEVRHKKKKSKRSHSESLDESAEPKKKKKKKSKKHKDSKNPELVNGNKFEGVTSLPLPVKEEDEDKKNVKSTCFWDVESVKTESEIKVQNESDEEADKVSICMNKFSDSKIQYEN